VGPTTDSEGLVDLVGEPRATVLRELKEHGERSAPELAAHLGISDVAVRRHLARLGESGLITDRTVHQDRGRPVARYRLTARGEQLFPHRYAAMIGDVFAYLAADPDRNGTSAFLRWRQERVAEQYEQHIDGEQLGERVGQLVEALREAGYEASAVRTEDGYELRQTHCAIYEVAREHPEVCAHETAVFRRVLGDARVQRRTTLADGGPGCVCAITPEGGCG
jgi:predicted ArsR family transcriptional regulator